MRFDLTRLAETEAYELLTRVVSPRPIAFVSTLSTEGRPNLAPFSYFNLGGLRPPSAVFCAVNDRRGRPKDTLSNIRDTGEYVINAVTRSMAERMNLTSTRYSRDINEFERAGFTAVASETVRPSRVLESPVSMECTLFSLVSHGEGPWASQYVIGEIHLVHVHDDLLDDSGLPEPGRIRFLGQMGGDSYIETRPEVLFEMPRPPRPKA
jgi:flavin reductase (DIM6/NTAB) family NADH-FMN oxidoreductase RutF